MNLKSIELQDDASLPEEEDFKLTRWRLLQERENRSMKPTS